MEKTKRPRKERQKLTDTVVRGLKPRDVPYEEWDNSPDLPGFGILVSKNGVKSWVVKFRLDGKYQRHPLGRWPTVNAEQARAEARRCRDLIGKGRVPKEEQARLEAEQKAKEELESKAVTVAKACQEFLAEHVEAKNRPSMVRCQKIALNNYIAPAWGPRKIKDIDQGDVSSLHAGIKAKTQANRVLACVSKLLSWCEVKKYRPLNSNPCKLIEKNPESKRQRYLKHEEMAAIEAELQLVEPEKPYIVAAIRLLARTGARLSEILDLTWDRVDLEEKVLVIPAAMHKSGRHTGDKIISLGKGSIAILKALQKRRKTEKHENPHVIRGHKLGTRLVNLEKAWKAIREAVTTKAREAGSALDVTDVRLHDLRHTSASIAAKAGHSLHAIGGTLGHTNQSTTQRYAHLMDETRVAVARDVDDAWSHVAKGKK